MTNMKLAIACVYYFGPGDDWILEVQLNQIEQATKGYDFQLYAAANRITESQKERLHSWPFVTILDIEPTNLRSSEEHAYYLDRLVNHALEDGCTHIATFDCDSFPIAQNWPHLLQKKMGDKYRIAAVFREENNDTFLPHPCGIFMEASFAVNHSPNFFPSTGELHGAAFQKFFEETGQRIDTGIGYAFALWDTKEPWLKLYRSNKMNYHWLLAGIYGDVIFHLGAGSRPPSFYRDSQEKKLLTLAQKMKGLPLLWRLEGAVNSFYVRRIRTIQRSINNALTNNPKALFDKLLGR